MIISEADATWAADEFINYFGNFTSIEDYLRFVKRELVPKTNPLMSHEDEFFNEDISPEEMEFEIRFIGDRFPNSLPQDHYKNLLAAVSSHNNESNIPGRELRWMVYEKRTQKIVGFIRFGSPTINSKPRNLWLGQPANLSLLNRHTDMGFVIVPSQPFGYNYLGGKLLSLLCCSHEMKRQFDEKYGTDLAFFETTSLYGSSKSSSQYDGLKPFFRYKGLTESKFLPLLHDRVFHKLHDRFTLLNNNTPLTDNKASSKKMKRQSKMIASIKKSLKDQDKLQHFNSVIEMALVYTKEKILYI